MRIVGHKNPDGTEVRVSLGDWVRLGEGVSLGDWVRLGDNIKVPDGLNGLTFQMGFYPMTVSGKVITSGCHAKTPGEWLKYLTRENCRREGLKDHFRPFYIDFVKTVIRLMGENHV